VEYLIAILVLVDLIATLVPQLRRKTVTPLLAPSDIHDHDGHDAGTLAELQQLGKLSGGRINLHDIEVVMRRRRDRRRRESV